MRRDREQNYGGERYRVEAPRWSGTAERARSDADYDQPNWGSARSDYGRRAFGGRLTEDGRERGAGPHDARRFEQRGERDRDDRNFIDRATDEVRSWFGDERAEHRGRADERRDYSERDREFESRSTRPPHETERRRESGFSREPDRLENLRAREVMTSGALTVRPDETVARAAQLMRQCDCGSLPVVNSRGRLIGMVTDRDITVRVVARGDDPRRTLVDDCMTREAFACNLYDQVEDCMRAMARHQIRRVPIIDDNFRVVGIISQGDLARFAGDHHGHGERRMVADVLCAVSEPASESYQ